MYDREPSMLTSDPPEHDRVRRATMRHFGPPHTPDLVSSQEDGIKRIVTDLLDKLKGKTRIDVVDEFAYPLPVSVICRVLGVEDVAPNGYAADRATVRQRKTGQPVRFELTELSRQAIDEFLRATNKRPGDFMFSGRKGSDRSMTTRQYARLVSDWIASIGLDPHVFGSHSLRRSKATLIYRRTGNLRAVRSSIESTVRYLGIEVDDALAIAEQVDV
jgi:integrase